MVTTTPMREKLNSLKARIGTKRVEPITVEAPKRKIKTTTEQMVTALNGGKANLGAAIKLQLKTKKSVVKKCHDKETVRSVEKAAPPATPPAITPVIFLQDNLLKVSRYLNLNELHLDTTNNDNSIDFTVAACRKLCAKGISFYVDASENPLPELLDEVSTGSLVKRYLPKGHEPFLQAMFITAKGKTSYEYAITFSQIQKVVGRGLSKLSQVSGNLTPQQAALLGLKFIDGEHFSYYASI